MPGSRFAYAASACLLLACAPDTTANLPKDLAWTSPHFEYHARSADSDICGEMLGTLEQHFQFVQNLLGFAWPSGRIIKYYKFVDGDDFAAHAPCPSGAGGCSDGDGVYSNLLFEQHELVHAYLWPAGLPPPVIAEGAAVALACNIEIPEAPTLPLRDAISVGIALDDVRIYETGGRLARYLLDSYGGSAFMQFYVDLHRGMTFAEMDKVAQSVYGASADDLWAAALATHASCPQPFDCSRAALPSDGTAIQVAPTCGLKSDVRTFTVLADGNVAITAPGGTQLKSCDPVPFASVLATTYWAGAWQIGLLQLAAGRYAIDFPTGPSTVAAVVPAQPWAGADCASLQPFVVGASEYPDLSVALPVGAPAWMVKLSFGGPHLLSVARGFAPNVAMVTATACPDCDFASPQCQTANLSDGAMNVLWDGDYVLRLETDDASVSSRVDILGR
jgi:hypothetical protein